MNLSRQFSFNFCSCFVRFCLFAGDTIYESSPPNTRFGDIDLWLQWKRELIRLKEMDIKNICPGHGKLCDKSIIDTNIKYLDEIIKGK